MDIDLAIVVVSYNTCALTVECLSSVYASLDGSPLRAHVWLVENASQDGSAAAVRARFPQATLIESAHNGGFSAGNNLALRAILALAKGPRYVLLLNSDTLVHPGALEALVTFLDQNPRAGIVGAALRYGDGAFQHSAFAFPTIPMALLDFWPLNHRLTDSRLNGRYPRRLYEAGEPFPVDHPLGAALMIRRATMAEIGLLDEGFFMYCEEIDWCMRAKRMGWEIYCVPRSVITHLGGRSAAAFRQKMFVELWRSRFRLFRKHYSSFYRLLAGFAVRAGVMQEARRTRLALMLGKLTAEEARSRLDAYHLVWELTHV